MGRLDVGRGISVDAEDSILDKLEDLDPDDIIEINMDVQLGVVNPEHADKRKPEKNARRRLEDRLDELSLLRQLTDYDYKLH